MEQVTASIAQNGPQPKPAERILQAALELFVEQGYFNTNVPDISKRSRCSVGSIYHHFLNKEEIASQLYRNGIDQFRTALSDALNPEASLDEAINAVIVKFMKFAEEHKLLSRYLWLARHTEFLSNKIVQPTVVGFDALGRKLTRIIKRAVRNGEVADLRAALIWTIVFGIPISYVRDWLDGSVSDSPSSIAPSLAQAALAALRGTKH